MAPQSRAAILVEGQSDQAALEALALRRGRDMTSEGIAIVAMGGITHLGKFIEELGPRGRQLRLAGLYDAAEEPYVLRSLRRAELDRDCFFGCEADLEDELIRALGTDAVERVLEAEDELESFRRFQKQPAQRGRSTHAHLRRFLGTRARRKVRYGSLLVNALSLERVPRPLDLVLACLRSETTGR